MTAPLVIAAVALVAYLSVGFFVLRWDLLSDSDEHAVRGGEIIPFLILCAIWPVIIFIMVMDGTASALTQWFSKRNNVWFTFKRRKK